MRELLACWQNTRMIVLIGLCAALYSVTVASLKFLTVIPGITEIRPGASLPIVFSIFFGPVGAWGSAFGNLVGDVMGGTIGPGSLFGLIGNFFYGYIPYRVARAFGANSSDLITKKKLSVFIFLVLLASAVCATIISTGVTYIGIPFDLVEHTILLNNMLMSFVLAPFLIRGLDKRVRQMKLNYEQLLDAEQFSKPLLGILGSIILLAICVVIYIVMMFPASTAHIANLIWFRPAAITLLILAGLVLL
jgi:energy-coupling factor transport system substrate-specific component